MLHHAATQNPNVYSSKQYHHAETQNPGHDTKFVTLPSSLLCCEFHIFIVSRFYIVIVIDNECG